MRLSGEASTQLLSNLIWAHLLLTVGKHRYTTSESGNNGSGPRGSLLVFLHGIF